MAPERDDSGGGTLASQINEELLICKICMGSFDTGNKLPRKLKCPHTFCEKCIVEFLTDGERKGSMKIDCPICGRSTKCGDDGIEDLEENQTVINLVALMKRQADKEAAKRGPVEAAVNSPLKQMNPEGNIWLESRPTLSTANKQIHSRQTKPGQKKLKGILKTKKQAEVEKCECVVVKSANKLLHPPPKFFTYDDEQPEVIETPWPVDTSYIQNATGLQQPGTGKMRIAWDRDRMIRANQLRINRRKRISGRPRLFTPLDRCSRWHRIISRTA